MLPRIGVLGLGYVGCVSAACLARLGYQVTGVDRDAYKVEAVRAGRAPFFEPGLGEIVRETVLAGRLKTTVHLADVIDDLDIALICVGTPSEKNGNLDIEQLRRVVAEIAALTGNRHNRLIVAVRSTVFPGTCERLRAELLNERPSLEMVCHPEFLREGVAIADFMEPSLLVAGGENEEAAREVAALYRGLNVEPAVVSLRTAEMIKYASNAFHALKVAFANEMGSVSQALGIDGTEVLATLCRDHRLNISAAYLKPGFAFGGSCLPKDLRALAYRAARLDLQLPLLESILPSNAQHLRRAIEAVMDLGPVRLGVIGLAFKENTDDLRESPVVALLEHLIGKGRELRVYDPHIQLNSIYGSNRRFILEQIPHIGKLLDTAIDETLAWAEHLVIAQKPSVQITERIRTSGLGVTDLTQSKLLEVTAPLERSPT